MRFRAYSPSSEWSMTSTSTSSERPSTSARGREWGAPPPSPPPRSAPRPMNIMTASTAEVESMLGGLSSAAALNLLRGGMSESFDGDADIDLDTDTDSHSNAHASSSTAHPSSSTAARRLTAEERKKKEAMAAEAHRRAQKIAEVAARATAREEGQEKTFVVWVGGLNSAMNPHILENHFRHCGPIVAVSVRCLSGNAQFATSMEPQEDNGKGKGKVREDVDDEDVPGATPTRLYAMLAFGTALAARRALEMNGATLTGVGGRPCSIVVGTSQIDVPEIVEMIADAHGLEIGKNGAYKRKAPMKRTMKLSRGDTEVVHHPLGGYGCTWGTRGASTVVPANIDNATVTGWSAASTSPIPTTTAYASTSTAPSHSQHPHTPANARVKTFWGVSLRRGH